MSNEFRLNPPGRNLRVLIARAAAETDAGQTGATLLTVKHDGWCRSLVTQSMTDCRCNPEMTFEPVDA